MAGAVVDGVQQPLFLRVLIAVFACVAYMGSASSLILLNKYILSNDGFGYPMALSSLGMGFSSIAAHMYCTVFGLNSEGAQVYLYLTVAFVQMLKALSPAVTMMTLFAFRLEKPTLPLIGSVLVITAGIGISSFGEVNFVMIGVIFMIVSIFADALRLVLIQFLLTNRAMHPLEALKFLAPACTIWLVLGTCVLEYPQMVASNAFGKIQARPWLYIAAGMMGFAVNSLCYAAIKLTSSLTIKVVSAGKDAFVVLFSVMVLQESVTELQGVGYSCSMAGFALYNYIKYKEAEALSLAADVSRGKVEADVEAPEEQEALLGKEGRSLTKGELEDGGKVEVREVKEVKEKKKAKPKESTA